MTHPHHETALMLLRAAGFDVGDGEYILLSTNVEWRLIKNVFLAMAAAVDAREKVLREALKAAHDAIAQIQSEYILGGYCQELLDAAEELVDAALEIKP